MLGEERAFDRFGLNFLLYPSARHWQAYVLALVGQFRDAIVYGRHALQLVEAANHSFSITGATLCLGRVYLIKGDAEQALHLLEQGRTACEAANINLLRPHILAPLGRAYALTGRLSDGLRLLEEAGQRAISMHVLTDEAMRLVWLSEAYLGDGRPAEAWDAAQQALNGARTRGERGHEAWAIRLLGLLAPEAQQPGRAASEESGEGYYRQALALADELCMRPLMAHCHLGLSALYERVGRQDEARSELATAAELYRAMEMTFWQEKAEVALAQVEAT